MKLERQKLDLAQARAQLEDKELLARAQVSNVTLFKIRTGECCPKPITVGKIAAALGVDPGEMLREEA